MGREGGWGGERKVKVGQYGEKGFPGLRTNSFLNLKGCFLCGGRE